MWYSELQRNSSTVIRVWKQWIDEHRTTKKKLAVDDEGSPSRQTIYGCVCNGLLSTEPGKLIGTNLSFPMNHASISGTLMVAFVLDTMPVNAAFQGVLSNDVVA
ncbi:transposable element Tcb2 transposase [Trichonephila clavipes]|nr:transposable element Tcb2 transposase [Trichonephila clavipes]